MSLEEKLINDIKKGKEVSLERALLIISGLQTEEEINNYIQKLNKIQKRFEKYKKKIAGDKKLSQTNKAKLLSAYFWKTKPKRYSNNFLLAEAIDSQLSKKGKRKVGDCVCLTGLDSVMGLREELNLSILDSPKHVRSRLRDGDKIIDIEHTRPNGFDAKKDEKHIELPWSYLIPITFNCRGVAKRRSGDLEGAIEDYTKSIEIYPEHGEAYNNRGIAKKHSGDLEGAIEDYDKAIKINPEDSEACYNRGIAKTDFGDLEGAIEDYDKAIKINPKYNNAYYNRGVVKMSLEDLKGAIEDFNKAIGFDPKDHEAYYNRGVAKRRLGDLKGAIKDYDKAIKINSKYDKAYNNRGVAKENLGDLEEAIKDYSKAIKINPMFDMAYDNRGAVKMNLGDLKGAIEDFNKALKINPKYNKAQDNLKIAMKRLEKFSHST